MRKDHESDSRQFSLLALCAALLTLFLPACANYGSLAGGAGEFNTVVVDAGHGGYDLGARAVRGMPEKMLTLDTATRLARVLRSKGFRVIENRRGDYFVPLGVRTATSNRASNAIFVSIHYNMSPRSSAHGIEVYYFSPRSWRLAANILTEVVEVYPTTNRGVKRNNYYVLRNNRKPAVLCELGFVSSPYDDRYIQNPAVRQRLAQAIAAGIMAERMGRSR